MNLKSTTNTMNLAKRLNSDIAIKRARFSKMYDYDGNKFFDFYLDNGNVFLGYSYKPFTKLLKNTISYGFLNYYPNHLELRAKKLLNDLYPNFDFYFFYNLISIKNMLQKYNIDIINYDSNNYIGLNKCLILGNRTLRKSFDLTDVSCFVLYPSISNGMQVYALGVKKDLNIPIKEDKLPIIYYQAIISTISEYKKVYNSLDKIFIEKLKDYMENIDYKGGGIFSVKSLVITKEIRNKLFEKCIFVVENQDEFFLCLETEPHQIKYFFKTLSSLKMI